MKIYEVFTADSTNSDRNQEVCAYVASKEIAGNYIRANLVEIYNVHKKSPLWNHGIDILWCADWTEKEFPGFIPDLVYAGKDSHGLKVTMFFKEIDVIEK